MPRAVTRRQIHGTSLRQVGWLRYPNGLGRLFQATAHPRLTHIMRSYDGETRTDAFWLVDGQPVESVDAAIFALNVPPDLTAEELEVLDLVPADWTAPGDLRARITADLPVGEHSARVRLLRSLHDKGCLEVEADRIRRTGECSA